VPDQETSKPKHRLLFEELGRAIKRGTFAPGQRLPTEAELMHQYGVSRTTVTRTLRDLEHRGVIWRRRGSGTFVKEIEPTTSDQFGMIVHGIEPGSIFMDIYNHLMRITGRVGAQIRLTHLLNSNHRIEEAADAAQRLIESGVKGVFYLPHSIGAEGDAINSRVTQLFSKAGVQVILLDRDTCDFPRRSEFDLISVDNTRGGYLVGQHLIDAGCKRAAFFSDKGTFSSARARYVGYRMAMEANGLEARAIGCDPDSADEVMQAIRQLKPDGIFCDNDRHAAIVMRHLLNAKVSIPGEVKVAGFDDTPTASLLAVPLTTVRQPAAILAQRAVSLMNDRIAHPQMPPAHIAVHCELVVRGSTMPTPDGNGKAAGGKSHAGLR
jgi:DNA-binding LacI/PurR family transcriptional regulator